MTTNQHQTIEERAEHGKSLRVQTPRSCHGEWSPLPDRPDPVSLIEEQNNGRLEWLIPVRRWRMSASPFTFFRGSARIMAADLASTPVSGLEVQVCGDAHLANFGLFPHRNANWCSTSMTSMRPWRDPGNGTSNASQPALLLPRATMILIKRMAAKPLSAW